MKYTGPKARRCRRQKMNLFGSEKYDRVLQRKPYPPGKSPKSRLGRQSEYAVQLQEKQRARDIYLLSERQFSRLCREAAASVGKTDELLSQLLERRLDNVVFRAGFARTRLQARQCTGHGLFLVDGVRVTCPSYRVSSGERITLRSQVKSSPLFPSLLLASEKLTPPSWLRVDPQVMSIEVVSLPTVEDVEQAVDIRHVVEFYSR